MYTMPMHKIHDSHANEIFGNFIKGSADCLNRLHFFKIWFERLLFVQRAYRKMTKSREIKRALLPELWDRFAEEERIKCSSVNKM